MTSKSLYRQYPREILNVNTPVGSTNSLPPPRRPRRVDHRQIAMSPFSPPTPGTLQDLKSLPLKLQLKAQDNGTFPIGVGIGLILLYVVVYLKSPYRKLPPGPRGYPIIGNVLDLRSKPWIKFAEWRKNYGKSLLSSSCLGSSSNMPEQVISCTSTHLVNT